MIGRASRALTVKRLIHKWQHRLGLSDWDIRYLDEPIPPIAPDESLACVVATGLFKKAQIWLDPAAPDADLEWLVLHELSHLVLDGLSNLADSMVPLVKGAKSRHMLEEMWSPEFERVINSFCNATLDRKPPHFGETFSSRHMSAFVDTA